MTTLLGPGAELVDVQARSLAGGLMAAFVLHLRVCYSDAGGGLRSRNLVVKCLDAGTSREARIYEALATTPAREFMPALEGIEAQSRDEAHLYLEAIEAHSAWPWSRVEDAARVLEQLALLHERAACTLGELVCDWDYERDLETQATDTLVLLEESYARGRDHVLGASLAATRRLVRDLRRWRRAMVDDGPMPSTVIHGDVHPGNVLIRARDESPVLLDWARARAGSPLEDVSSWLQWLGFWEPAVKRKHDTLLARYLTARGLGPLPSHAFRAAYWLAGASNCLAGALRYHLLVLRAAESGAEKRAASQRAVNDCLRVLRRADAYERGRYPSDRSTSNATRRCP